MNHRTKLQNRPTGRHLLSLFSFLLSSCSFCGLVSAEKVHTPKLVFLAGPKYAGSNSIHQFFLDHASTYNGNQIHPSFLSWSWPGIYGPLVIEQLEKYNLPPRSAFDLLLTEANNEELQEYMMGQIASAMENGDVVIGTTQFDDPQPGIDVMQRIEKLAPGSLETNVVLMYRWPRIDQWITAWSSDFNDDYWSFLCAEKDSAEYQAVLQVLDVAMNPLRLAWKYTGVGFRVKLVDWSGIEQRDISQVVACDVMGYIDCNENGNVIGGLWKENIHLNEKEHELPDYVTPEIQRFMAELLEFRDCTFMFLGMGAGRPLNIVLRNQLWRYCDENAIETYKEEAGSSALIYDRFREKINCEGGNPALLKESEAAEPKELEHSSSNEESKHKSFFGRLTVPLLFVIAIGAGMYQYNVMNETRSNIFSSMSEAGSNMFSSARGPPASFPSEGGFRDSPFEGEMVGVQQSNQEADDEDEEEEGGSDSEQMDGENDENDDFT
jgi:hypothetical protein